MAASQSHTLGEFIGAFFEDLMKAPIRKFSAENGLYFDSAGARKARKGKKITWTDVHGNRHDLDFVVERGGTDAKIGEPVAFIELAWRRYTRHSKNKVQEIAGALDPICEKYRFSKPFKGAVLCGQFTDAALKQLENDGFHVLHIQFEKLASAFRAHGLDIEYDEHTTEAQLRKKHAAVSKKANRKILDDVRADLLKDCECGINRFLAELKASCDRKIKTICILPLHGRRMEVCDIGEAIELIDGYKHIPAAHKLEYFEVVVKYGNGTIIQGQFKEKDEAIAFLESISSFRKQERRNQ